MTHTSLPKTYWFAAKKTGLLPKTYWFAAKNILVCCKKTYWFAAKIYSSFAAKKHTSRFFFVDKNAQSDPKIKISQYKGLNKFCFVEMC
jgi:hypothetical protein